MLMYTQENTKQFAKDFSLQKRQASVLVNYMAGSGYSLGSENGRLYRFDDNEGDDIGIEYSVREAALVIREWIEEFVDEIENDGEAIGEFFEDKNYAKKNLKALEKDDEIIKTLI